MGLAQYTDEGLFAPGKIAHAFHTTSEEVARSAGLGRDAIQRKDRVRSDKTQRRLREMVVHPGPHLRCTPFEMFSSLSSVSVPITTSEV